MNAHLGQGVGKENFQKSRVHPENASPPSPPVDGDLRQPYGIYLNFMDTKMLSCIGDNVNLNYNSRKYNKEALP